MDSTAPVRWPWGIVGCRSSMSPAAPSRWPTRTARSGSRTTESCTTSWRSGRSSRPKGIATRPFPTRKAWCIFTRKTGSISSVGSTECLPWPSGTSRASGLCWHATGWGRSPSSTPSCPAAAWLSVPSPRRCFAIPRSGASSTGTAWPATCFTNTSPRPTRSGAGCGNCRAAMY